MYHCHDCGYPSHNPYSFTGKDTKFVFMEIFDLQISMVFKDPHWNEFKCTDPF